MSGIYAPGYFQGGPETYIVEQLELSHEWIVSSKIAYPEITIHVTQIGETVLEKPAIADAFKEYLDRFTVRIKFDSFPAKGFVILHQN